MGKEEQMKTALFQSIIGYVRDNHAEEIDKAYTFFWDEHVPDEFLAGTALEIGFHNFEDWLVFDRKTGDDNKGFIDIFLQRGGLTKVESALLEKIKGTVLSLFEVVSVSKDKRVLIKDLLRGSEYSLRDKSLTRGLKKGDLFATRLLELDGGHVMSSCVYPFQSSQKKKVLAYVNKQFARFIKNVKPDGTMDEYLKEYGDVFNLIWIDIIQNPPEKAA
jgi:hypothetical protein